MKVGDNVVYCGLMDARGRMGLAGVIRATFPGAIERYRVEWSDGLTLTHEQGYVKLAFAVTPEEEYTGGSSSYYAVEITKPTSGDQAYSAECNDIIEALCMNYAEGNVFKAVWRRAAQRALGKKKKGADESGLYDAEKIEFFGKRLVEQSRAAK